MIKSTSFGHIFCVCPYCDEQNDILNVLLLQHISLISGAITERTLTMKIKRLFACCLALFTVAAIAAGCGEDSESKPERKTSSSSSAKEAVDEKNDSADEKESSAAEKSDNSPEKNPEADTDNSKNSSESSNENSDSSDSAADEGDNSQGDKEKESDDKVVGNTGMTVSEWLSNAQNIYDNAARMKFRYICPSTYFTCDDSDIKEEGRWIRVTSCETLEEAAADYYSVFAETGHESDLDNSLRMIDGVLYCSAGARGGNMTYQGSEITELTDSTDDTLTFKVISTYDDTTEENIFTLVYERGVWRVGEFTMPY